MTKNATVCVSPTCGHRSQSDPYISPHCLARVLRAQRDALLEAAKNLLIALTDYDPSHPEGEKDVAIKLEVAIDMLEAAIDLN